MPRQTLRFHEYELDLAAYELRREGRRVKLERRPMDLLILLIERRGELISRSEIVERLWGQNIFVEVDSGVNTLVRKVRQALRDSPETPTFVETVAGKGYRFIAPVAVTTPPDVPPSTKTTDVGASSAASVPSRRRSIAIAAILLVVLAAGVWGWRAMRSRPSVVRLAVLPFESNAEGEYDYLADALHDETIAALGQLDPRHIKVIARRSTLQYRGTSKPLLQIAQELGVQYVVETSIFTERERIRVLAKLLRADDQTQIWSDQYDDEPRSILDFQRRLGVQIANEIGITLSPDRLGALARRHTTNEEAFHLYLKGLNAWNRLKPPQTTDRAIGYYTQAAAIDPNYSLPWAGLALAYAGMPVNADVEPATVANEARRTAARAIDADPRLAEALTAVGAVKFWFDWDWNSAAAKFREASDADPNYAFSRRMLGILASYQGRHDEAREHMRQLVTLEPDYEMNWALRSFVEMRAGEYAEAIKAVERGRALQPDFWIGDLMLASTYGEQGKYDLALDTIARYLAAPRPNTKLLSLKGYIFGKTGRQQEARAVLTQLDSVARTRWVPPTAHALVHAGLGDRDEMFTWLERAVDARDVHLMALPTGREWRPFRDDPRFSSVLKRGGLPAPQ